MNGQEIIEMARESGLRHHIPFFSDSEVDVALNRFAKLVAAKATDEANARANASWTLMCKKMVEAEREACDQLVNDDSMLSDNDAIRLSRAIRART